MENIKNILKSNLDPSIYIIDVKRDVHTNTLKIVVDMDEELTLGMTAKISKQISTLPELDELYPAGYQMEVTSPGVGADLLFPFQYKKNIGRKLALKVDYEGKKKSIIGKLLEVNDQGIKILSKNQELEYNFDSILNAIVKISFK